MERIETGLVRLIAPNPSPMTERGTNTWILGNEAVTVIDPGPDDPVHLRAILAAVRDRPVEAILVTHAHLDHSPLAGPLAQAVDAPVLAYGNARAGRSPGMAALAGLGGGEGVDPVFEPDQTLDDGEVIDTAAGPIEALWTPGHFGNHLSFAWRGAVFSGDLVMGWASSLVSPPDGDLTAFMASCRRLRAMETRRLFPGHGAPVDDPAARIDWLIAHRESREAQILAALRDTPGTPRELAGRVYTDTPPALLPAATRNVLAHLLDLLGRELVICEGPLSADAVFSISATFPLSGP